jgi:hypothetical protein
VPKADVAANISGDEMHAWAGFNISAGYLSRNAFTI